MYSRYCVRDTFEFLDVLNESVLPPNGVLCSFDVVSLFTNVPLLETVDICANALYHSSDVSPPTLSETSFKRLMIMVTTGVEFSFDDVMYRQSDGVAMGSPLGPVLANVFMGYCESLIPSSEYPPLYRRFVDDSFAYFANVDCLDVFKRKLDCLHPSLKFTCEFESSDSLSFLDVLVKKKPGGGFVTSVYRKPSFTGLCLQWDSYCPRKYKVGLVKCLVNRAIRICSSVTLSSELLFLKNLFHSNGYPTGIINRYVTDKPLQLPQSTAGPIVIIRLPYTGPDSIHAERKVRNAVRGAFSDVQVVTVYNTRRAFTMKKDVLPTHLISKVIYSFKCRQCVSRYLGRTLQHLNARIKQHVPLHLLPADARAQRPKRGRPPKLKGTTRVTLIPTVTAITGTNHSDACFDVITRGRSPGHLAVVTLVLTL